MSEWDEFKWLRVIHQVVHLCVAVLENSEGRDEPGKKSLAFPPAIAGKGICFASNSKGT